MTPALARTPSLTTAGLLLLVASLNGITFSLAKIVMAGGVPPLAYAFWQCGIPGLFLLVLLLLRGERLRLDRQHLGYYVFCAVVGMAGPNIAFNYLIPHLPAGLSAVLLTFAPLMTYGAALLVGSERADRRRMAGLLLGFLGALMIVLPRSSLPSPQALPWVFFALILPATLATYSVFADRLRPPKSSSLALACGMLVMSGILQAPLMLALDQAWFWPGAFDAAKQALLAHIAITGLVVFLYFHILQDAGPLFFSLAGYLVTLTAILWGYVFFSEVLSFWVYGATAVIFLGLAIFQSGARQKAGAAA